MLGPKPSPVGWRCDLIEDIDGPTAPRHDAALGHKGATNLDASNIHPPWTSARQRKQLSTNQTLARRLFVQDLRRSGAFPRKTPYIDLRHDKVAARPVLDRGVQS